MNSNNGSPEEKVGDEPKEIDSVPTEKLGKDEGSNEIENSPSEQLGEAEEENTQQVDKMDLVRMMEKFSPEKINKYVSSPLGVFKNSCNVPSVDELTGKMFDGFLKSRLKDESKWESKCNFKPQEKSENLEQDYNSFLEDVSKLEEEAAKSSKKIPGKKKKKKKSLFSRLKKKIIGGEGEEDTGEANSETTPHTEDTDEETNDELPPENNIGFLEQINDIENYFIDKWKGVDLYQIFDELQPKPVIHAFNNPKVVLTNKIKTTQTGDSNVCGNKWDLILDHMSQIRIRSQVIYIESLKTVNPDFESFYDSKLLTQDNFEFDPNEPDKNPDGFKLDESIHYYHEPKPKKKLSYGDKISRSLNRKLSSLKYTKKKLSENTSKTMKNIKKSASEKISSAGEQLNKAGQKIASLKMPSILSSSSEHDKKLDKHLEFQAANLIIKKVNEQSKRMEKNSKDGRELARQPYPKLNLAQKVAAHGVGGEDNFRNIQRRFNSPTGKAYGNYIGI